MPHPDLATLTSQLTWLVEAPTLLCCPTDIVDAGTLLQREYRRDDSVPRRAAALLADQPRPRRLGLVFEQWVAALIHASEGLELVAHNLPLREQGRTLGELDMLVRDRDDDSLWHWELALKFYLGTADAWYGPNRHDTLERKAAHLFEQQLPRSAGSTAQQWLALHGWQLHGQALLTRGRLFYRDAIPAGILPAPGHERGWWLPAPALAPGHWRQLERQFWPCPFVQDSMQDKSTNLVDSTSLIDYVESSNRPVMVSPLTENNPGFVVPSSWPRG